ncbi:MAG: hypothetical protein IKX60_00430 [Bacteroidales bacterium]|nr:hypothetical protein [Bacteroidales bacterium]
MMKRTIHRTDNQSCRSYGSQLLAVLCLLLSFAMFTSCYEEMTPDKFTDPMARELTLRFYLPGVIAPATKTVAGDVASVSDPESRIYNVKVWAFNHVDLTDAAAVAAADNQMAVAYTEVQDIAWNNTSNLPNGSNYYAATYWADTYTLEVKINFPGYIMGRTADQLKFDFYVLANASSIGVDPTYNTTRGDLKALTFGYTSAEDDLFGPYQQNRATWGATPSAAINGSSTNGPGLPISGFFNKDKNGAPNGVDLSFLIDNTASMTLDEVREQLPIVQMERGVSKLRFFFTQPTGMTGASVTKIEILTEQIPAQTYVFPREDGTEFQLPATDGGVTYVFKAAEIPGPTSEDIVELEDPETLKATSDTYSTATAQAYETALDNIVGEKTNTQRFVYLRESDKALTCRIYYKMSETSEETYKEFSMSDVADYSAETTNFHRNHYWTVYAYFMGGQLFVKPTVADWIDTPVLDYTMKMNTNMRLFDSWLYRYDTDGSYEPWTNWATSHMAVSSGRVTTTSAAEPVAGRPLRSPQIQLITTGDDTFELHVDNDAFEIIRANKNDTGVVTSYEASTDGVLTIPAGDDVYTYFYIVPKEGVTPTNPVAKVSLIYNDSVLGPQKVTFNYSSLPGYSDDSSEIWAYYFDPENYNITGKLKMYFVDYNNPLVPTPVQN